MTAPTRTVVVAGGGTAGHIEPAMNLADHLRRADPATTVVALGTAKGLETTLVPQRGYPLELIEPVPMPRKPDRDLLTLPGRVRSAVHDVADILDRLDADVLVGFGGYVALPGYLGARRGGVPYVVHEANARPGLANRLGARGTPFVAENYPGSLPHAVRTGLPLRPAITDLDRAASRTGAAAAFDLDPARPTLLVFGGSQGAKRLNEAVWAALPQLWSRRLQILHAIGPRTTTEPPAPPPGARLRYRPYAFIDRMDLAYAAADLAVCRSGAMTCGEIAAVGLPACYVPFPIGNGEQRLNADPVVRAGGGIIVDDADLTAERFLVDIVPLLSDGDALAAMARAARQFGVRDGAQRLAVLVERAAASRIRRET